MQKIIAITLIVSATIGGYILYSGFNDDQDSVMETIDIEQDNVSILPKKGKPKEKEVRLRSMSSMQETIKRPLFNPSRKPTTVVVESKTKNVERRQNPGTPQINIALSAIVIVGEDRIAVIQKHGETNSVKLRVGDNMDDWEVIEIGKDMVAFGYNGEIEEFKLRNFESYADNLPQGMPPNFPHNLPNQPQSMLPAMPNMPTFSEEGRMISNGNEQILRELERRRPKLRPQLEPNQGIKPRVPQSSSSK